MKSYEDDLYTGWFEMVEATLPDLLKKNVLCKPPCTVLHSVSHSPTSRYSPMHTSIKDKSLVMGPGTYVCMTDSMFYE